MISFLLLFRQHQHLLRYRFLIDHHLLSLSILFYHITCFFTICKRARKKADQESQLPIGIFSYSSSFLHSISVPSKNTTNNVPSSKTLMWSSVFSMKSVSISVKGSAPSVYSMNFSAR